LVDAKLPLSGMKVIDVTRHPPGRHCTMLLSDMGAEVIEVEEIRTEVNVSSESYQGALYERETPFSPIERNKQRIALNLKHPEGLNIFMALAEGADVLVEAFRPGVMDRLGLGYKALSKRNPRLVYCSLSGYGQTGPYRDLPGHDMNYVAMAGVLDIIGPADGPPIPPHNLVADYAGGALHATIGILFALLSRERTGKGQYVDVALTDGSFSMIGLEVARYFARGAVSQRGKEVPNGGSATYNVFQAKDKRYVTVAFGEDKFYDGFCRLIEREDLISWHKESTKNDELLAILRKVFLTKTSDEWTALLFKAGLPVAKVQNIKEAVADPQIRHRGLLVEFEGPDGGTITQVGHPIKYSGMQPEYRKAGGYYAQDTDRVLAGLGKSKQELARLRVAGAIL